jgi:copper chaperone NosL
VHRRAFLRRCLRLAGAAAAGALLPRTWVAAEPHPTEAGVDTCPYCSMTIVDLRFAAQVVTPTGLVLHYDAIECLADHLNGHGPTPPEVAEAYLAEVTTSSLEGAEYLPAEEAVVLYHPRLRTPMGGGLAAFADVASAQTYATDRRLQNAETLTWSEVLARGADDPWVPDY